ncbi:efflux transporter outer membrane subunit [Hyphococcus sp. DH-69]|uniref:efflux transporter outer membrane subunit n=1 Tax=Hyphococcus formosus TaxID=3143534 RepID=UPI00398ABF10
MSHSIKIGFGLFSLLFASGCATMAPDYNRPESVVNDVISYSEGGDMINQLYDWKAVFPDPTLQRLINVALKNNRDVRIATLNVERARAAYQIQRSDSLPSISANGTYTRQHFGENASANGTAFSSGSEIDIEQFSANAGVSAYELDLFGRVRSLNRQALNNYLATDEERKTAEILLVSEVANAYLRLISDRELLQIAKDTADSQEASLNLTELRVENGIGTDLDVQRAITSIERAKADVAILEAQTARDVNALQLLLGVSELPSLNADRRLEDIAIARSLPDGVPSGVLLSRPDVIAAENRLIAANANIGAARAAFFPRILLTASAGSSTAELSDLFASGTGVWNFSPSISLPIFTGGRNRAQLKSAKIDRDIALSEYEKAIQTAFREVADALATRNTIDARLSATKKLAQASANTFFLSNNRFENGVDDYLAVLDAQRADYAARQELVAAQLAEAVNVIEIFRALGGPVKLSSDLSS